jgi:hypothetical protein
MRRTAIIGGVLVALIAATTLWRFATRTDRPTTSPPSTAADSQSVGSSTPRSATATTTTILKSVSPEGDRSEASAVRAAIRFLKVDEQLFPSATPERARSLSDSITGSSDFSGV